MEEIRELQTIIANLEARKEYSGSTKSDHRAARNRLAYLTASIFVVVDDGRSVTTYGVAPDIYTTTDKLWMSLTSNKHAVDISLLLSGVPIASIYLSPGDRAKFSIPDPYELHETIFNLFAFSGNEEAEAFVDKRQAEKESD